MDLEDNETFTVSGAYNHINDGGTRCPYVKTIWSIKASLKVRASFGW